MRPFNLIPPEERRGERAPLRSGPLAYAVVGVLLLAFVGVYALVSTSNVIAEREAQAAGLEQELSSVEAQTEALRSFTDFANLEQARSDTVYSLARSRFDWERVMRELAFVIPGDVSLTSLSGSVGGEEAGSESGGAPTAGTEGIAAPNLTMNGCGHGQESVARMVAALRDIDGVTRVGLSSSVNSAGEDDVSGVTGSGSDESGTGCTGPGATAFQTTVAFDEVQIASASVSIGMPTDPASPAAGDGSGVVEAKRERDAAKNSVDSGEANAREAVDRYIPGT